METKEREILSKEGSGVLNPIYWLIKTLPERIQSFFCGTSTVEIENSGLRNKWAWQSRRGGAQAQLPT